MYLYQSPVNSKTGLWATTVYANDAWQVNNRLTLNLGVRLDRYQPFLPEQIGPAGQNFAAVDNILVWKNIGPRLGASYDMSGKGKTVREGQLRPILALSGRPTSPTASTRTRRRGARSTRGATPTPTAAGTRASSRATPTSVTGGTAATVYDPDIQNTFSHQVMVFVEHEAAPNLGVRTGIVWNGRRQLTGSD